VIVVLAIWQSLIVANQFPLPRLRRVLNRTRLRLFPEWKMFTGPQIHLMLYCRSRFRDGTVGDWMEIPTSMEKSWQTVFWNPSWDHFWSIHYLMERLFRMLGSLERSERKVEDTMPYQALKHYVSRRFSSAESEAMQFRFDRSFGHVGARPPEAVYQSEFFGL
jgi:hypothetical protein